jgi:hypothetical protein
MKENVPTPFLPHLANHIFYVEVLPMQDLSAVVTFCIEDFKKITIKLCYQDTVARLLESLMFLFMSINICHSSFGKR